MREAMDVNVRVREREKENEVRKQPRIGGPRGAFLTKQNGLFILSKKNRYIKDYISIYKFTQIVSSILFDCCLEPTVATA